MSQLDAFAGDRAVVDAGDREIVVLRVGGERARLRQRLPARGQPAGRRRRPRRRARVRLPRVALRPRRRAHASWATSRPRAIRPSSWTESSGSASTTSPARAAPGSRGRRDPGTRPDGGKWAMSSTPSTTRGLGRENIAFASTAKTALSCRAGVPSRCAERSRGTDLRERAVEIEPARREHDHVRLERGDVGPAHPVRGLAGHPGDVDASRGRDHVRNPVPGRVGRLEPLGDEDAGATSRPRRARRRRGRAGSASRPSARRPLPRLPAASRARRSSRRCPRASRARSRAPRRRAAAPVRIPSTWSVETAQTSQSSCMTTTSASTSAHRSSSIA